MNANSRKVPGLADKISQLQRSAQDISPSSHRSTLNLVTYVNSIQNLNFNELQALKHIVTSSQQIPQSAFRIGKKPKARSVGFCEYVIEKQKQSIYLTKLTDADSQDEWKYKTIIDQKLLNNLEQNINELLSKYRNINDHLSTNSSVCSINRFSNEPIEAPRLNFTNKKSKPKPISQIYSHKITLLYDQQPNIYPEVQIPVWNAYWPSFLAFFNSRRDILSETLIPADSQHNYLIRLYRENGEFCWNQISDLFEQLNGKIYNKYMEPLELRNGKLEIWNSIMDKYWRNLPTSPKNLKPSDFMRNYFGLPVYTELIKNIVCFDQFLKSNASNNILFVQDKTTCHHVQSTREWMIQGQYCLVVILNTFQKRLRMNIKNNQIYNKCSQIMKLLIEDLQKQHKIVVLYEDLVAYMIRVNLCCYISDLTNKKYILSSHESLALKLSSMQQIVIRVQSCLPNTSICFAFYKIKKTFLEEYICYDSIQTRTLYETLDKGLFQLKCTGRCRIDLYYSERLMEITKQVDCGNR